VLFTTQTISPVYFKGKVECLEALLWASMTGISQIAPFTTNKSPQFTSIERECLAVFYYELLLEYCGLHLKPCYELSTRILEIPFSFTTKSPNAQYVCMNVVTYSSLLYEVTLETCLKCYSYWRWLWFIWIILAMNLLAFNIWSTMPRHGMFETQGKC
jgi:hypothetical protein